MKSQVRKLSIMAALVGALLLPLGAAPANAYPSGCSYRQYNTFVTGYCSGGTGKYRIWAVCWDTAFWRSDTWVVTSWYTPGSWWHPALFCPFGYNTSTAGIDAVN